LRIDMHSPALLQVPKTQAAATAPVGVFDSGVGGISVLSALRRRLPQQALLYLADSAHAPYGDRDAAFIEARAMALTQQLQAAGACAVVVACNTATVVAVQRLRQHFQHLPIVALEPAIKPAVALSRSGVVGVLATSRTLESASVQRLCRLHSGPVRVLGQACPGLVEQVERGELDSPATQALLQRYVQPLLDQGADTLVLGCTHYPFLRAQIQALAGPAVQVLDSADAVARELQRRLQAQGDAPAPAQGAAPAPAINTEPATTAFFTTGDPAAAGPVVSRLWGAHVEVGPAQALPFTTTRP
jgi:glutamate racemase